MISFKFQNATPLTQEYKVTMTGWGTGVSTSIVAPDEILTLLYNITPPRGTVLTFTVQSRGRVIHRDSRMYPH